MAKQIGLFKFTGKLGNLVGYKLNGKYITRTIGAVDRHKMQTAPHYAVTRQNQSLFATASRAGKAFRHALLPFTQGLTDSSFASRVVSVMLQSLKLSRFQPDQLSSVSQGFQQSQLKQAFRRLSIFNHHAHKHIPNTLLQESTAHNQFIINPHALWRKASDKSRKTVEFGYLHMDFDTSECTYESILSTSYTPAQLPIQQSIQLPKNENANSPCSFLIVQVHDAKGHNHSPVLQNIFVLDIIDHSFSKPEVLDKVKVASTKHSKIIQLHNPSSYPLISLALCSYHGSKSNESLVQSSPHSHYNTS